METAAVAGSRDRMSASPGVPGTPGHPKPCKFAAGQKLVVSSESPGGSPMLYEATFVRPEGNGCSRIKWDWGGREETISNDRLDWVGASGKGKKRQVTTPKKDQTDVRHNLLVTKKMRIDGGEIQEETDCEDPPMPPSPLVSISSGEERINKRPGDDQYDLPTRKYQHAMTRSDQEIGLDDDATVDEASAEFDSPGNLRSRDHHNHTTTGKGLFEEESSEEEGSDEESSDPPLDQRQTQSRMDNETDHYGAEFTLHPSHNQSPDTGGVDGVRGEVFDSDGYDQRNQVVPSFLIDDALQEDEIKACPDGHKVEPQFDADSFVFITNTIKDFRNLHFVDGIKFFPTHEARAPKRVRVKLPRSSSRNFTPCNADGSRPKSYPTLDEFPGINVATILFKGAVSATLSLHIVGNGDILGTKCPRTVPRTWNYAFNQAIRNYGSTTTFQSPEWERESRMWTNGIAGRLYDFAVDGRGGQLEEATIYGHISIFLLEMIFDILEKLAGGQWTFPNNLEDVTSEAAELIVEHSILAVQSAGFKDCWPGMIETLGVEPLPPPPLLNRTSDSVHGYNRYLQQCYQETYRRAHAFFFKKEGMDRFQDFSSSAFVAIDIAVVFSSTDPEYNLLPNGIAAAAVVDAAAIAKKSEIIMPDDNLVTRTSVVRPPGEDENESGGSSSESEDNSNEAEDRENSQDRRNGSMIRIRGGSRTLHGEESDGDDDGDTSSDWEESTRVAGTSRRNSRPRFDQQSRRGPNRGDRDRNILSTNTDPDQGDEEENKYSETDFALDAEMDAGYRQDGSEYRNNDHLPAANLTRRPAVSTNPLSSEVPREIIQDIPNPPQANPTGGEEEQIDDFIVFDRVRELAGLRYMLRTRFPLCATTGRTWGNFQRKPGLAIPVQIGSPDTELEGELRPTDIFSEHLTLCTYHDNRACPIVQIYEPSTRAGLQDKTKRRLRREARQIPQRIAQFASELEELIAYGHSGRKKKKLTNLFQLIGESFQVLDSWLERLKVHTMQTRYELTFATALSSQDREKIHVPIFDENSPLSCLSFVKRKDLFESMSRHVNHHRHILMDGFCALKIFPKLKHEIPRPVWTAYMASGEQLMLLLGAGAGSKGSMLEVSVRRARDRALEDNTPSYYDRHMWVIHPDFIIPVNTPNPCSWDTCVTEGVDPSICNIQLNESTLPQLWEQEENRGSHGLQRLKKRLPIHLVESLRGLRNPSQYRTSVEMMYHSFLQAGDPETDPNILHIFQNVNWRSVGQSVAAVHKAFQGCASVIKALYRVELAERIAFFWKDHRRDFTQPFDLDQAIQDIYASNTESEIVNCVIRHHGRNYWPYPIMKDEDNIKMAEQVYTLVTGYEGINFPSSIPGPKEQGWTNLAVPRCIISFGRMCRMVTEVHPDVLEEFGGRDPFRDLLVFQHFLASEFAQHRLENDLPFLFKSRKSELRFEKKPFCLLLEYNPELQMEAIRNGLSLRRENEIDPDNIQQDGFAGAFLSIRRPENFFGKLQKMLDKDLRSEFRKTYSNNDYFPCHQILLLQAYIIFFYRNQGCQVKNSRIVMLNKYSSLIHSIYPTTKSIQNASRRVLKTSAFKDSLPDYNCVNDFSKLKNLALEKWKVKDEHLFHLATSFLKPPLELRDVSSHEEAWADPGQCDKLLSSLHKIQLDMATDTNPSSHHLSFSSYVCSLTGIMTPQFSTLVKHIRDELRVSIEMYHGDPTQANLKACQELEDKYCVTKGRNFNFSERLSKKDSGQVPTLQIPYLTSSPLDHNNSTPVHPQSPTDSHGVFNTVNPQSNHPAESSTPSQSSIRHSLNSSDESSDGYRADAGQTQSTACVSPQNHGNNSDIGNHQVSNTGEDALANNLHQQMLQPVSPEDSNQYTNIMSLVSCGESLRIENSQETILLSSLQTLAPLQWVNDEVVNLYMHILQNNTNYDGKSRTYIFSSHFYTALTNSRKPGPRYGMYEYSNVAGWGNNVEGGNIFDFDRLIMPINLMNDHWICALILPKKERICIYDSLGYYRSDPTADEQKISENLMNYLRDEHVGVKRSRIQNNQWETIFTPWKEAIQKDGTS